MHKTQIKHKLQNNKNTKRLCSVKSVFCALFVFWFLCFVFFAPVARAGWFDNFKTAARQVQGFGSVPSLNRGDGVSGAEVPVFDRATRAIQEKEVGGKSINIPGTKGFLGVSVSWDKLAWGLANMAIHKITKDIVSWIKTGGRDGKPLFITNWEEFLKEVGNDASGIFIKELGLTEICQPFKLRLQLLLGGGGSYRQRAQCTIKDVARNVERFYKDFKQGGWERWFEITMVPQNNFYGAYYMSLEEKLLRESLAVEAKKSEALAGGGFLGEEAEICVRLDPVTKKCVETEFKILTPGKTIQEQLDSVLRPPSAEARLEVADEIDEIVSAAFTRLSTSIRGKTNSKGEKQGIISPEPLKQFIDDTQMEVPGAIQQVSDTVELPQAIALAQQTITTKHDSITKAKSLFGVLEGIDSCQNKTATSSPRIIVTENNIKQLNEDVQNLTILKTQLEEGERQLAQSQNTDDVYQLFTDLKAAVDIVIFLHDSAVAENNQIAAEISSAEQELKTCQEQGQI